MNGLRQKCAHDRQADQEPHVLAHHWPKSEGVDVPAGRATFARFRRMLETAKIKSLKSISNQLTRAPRFYNIACANM